jgi:ABC-2 type transport system permease protein
MSSPSITAPTNVLIDRFSKAFAIFMRDARLARSYDLQFYFQWATIALQVVAFYFIAKLTSGSPMVKRHVTGGDYFTWVIIGLAFARFQTMAIQCFQMAVRNDQMLGTLEVVLATPTGLPTVVLSAGLWAFVLTACQVAFFLLVAIPFGLNLSHTNFLTMVVFLILIVVCMSSIGVMAAATIMTYKQNAGTGFVAGSSASLLGGVQFPITLLPLWLQKVSWCLPITHALNGMRAAVTGLSLAQTWYDAVWLCVATTILLPISLFYFHRAVQRAKMDGTLGHY